MFHFKIQEQRAKLFLQKSDYHKSKFYYNLGLSTLYKGLITKKHIKIALVYQNLAKVSIGLKKYNESLTHTQSALIALSQTFNSTNYQDNPTISDVFSKKDLLEILDFKAGLLLDMSKKQPQYLEAAYHTAQLAAQLIDTIRADYTSDFDKQYLAEWSYGVYEKAINAAYLRYQKEGNAAYLYAAFNALERSKAIVLLEALRTGQAENALADDDRNRLYQFKAELQKLETQIYTETTQNKKTPDDPSVRNLQNRLFETRQQYEALVKSFETRYPDYFRVKFGQKFAQLADIQALLPQNGSSAVLEYFVGNDALFTFVITKNNCTIYKTDKPKDFDTRIETMRQTLTQQHSSTDFIPQAVWLYDILLKQPLQSPALAYNTNLKKLIIVPDGILHYVPFEMLVESSTPSVFFEKKYAKIPYLIKKYTIGYAYSGNLLLMQNQKSSVLPTHLFAAFAPQYKAQDAAIDAASRTTRAALTRDNAYDLPYAQKEVAQIHSIMGGHQYIGNAAKERVFKDKAGDYRLLHFAMHAMPDSLNPLQSRLLFNYNAKDTLEDHDVTAAEIYALHLNADLAVLSACQTGYGKINRGEGVLSLSRAFAYSGAKATVMSQWVVNDFATQEIMVDFYINLKAGQAKDDALRNAKLAYIERHPESELRTPYYWAGFVVAGNMSPLDMWDASLLRWITAGVLCAIVLIIMWLRQIKNK
jgi:CHAT domain-containing protein